MPPKREMEEMMKEQIVLEMRNIGHEILFAQGMQSGMREKKQAAWDALLDYSKSIGGKWPTWQKLKKAYSNWKQVVQIKKAQGGSRNSGGAAAIPYTPSQKVILDMEYGNFEDNTFTVSN